VKSGQEGSRSFRSLPFRSVHEINRDPAKDIAEIQHAAFP
jgi:hypothetical protein